MCGDTKAEDIYEEILAERSHQESLGGGPEKAEKFDDENTPADWSTFISRYACLEYERSFRGYDPKLFRANMVKVAALAVAAIESFDRKAARRGS